MDALVILHTKLESVELWLTLVLFFLHQVAPLHLAVESNRIKMVQCLLDQGADFDLLDDNEVILHTNAVDYFEIAGRYYIHPSVRT